jgi:hypothetical protein
MRALRDEALLIDIISVSFAEIAQNSKYTYAGFADQIDRTVQRHLRVPVAIPRRVKEPKKKPVPQCLGQHNEEPELRRLSHLKAANKATGRTLSLVAEDVERVRKATATPFHYIENPNAVWVENSNELNLTRLLRRALAKCLRFVRFR